MEDEEAFDNSCGRSSYVQVHCPYEEIGCKFSHEPVKTHDDDDDLEQVSDDDDNNDSYEFVENQCHLCKLQLLNRDDLYNHVETFHQEYHQGMLEIIADRRNII